MGGKSGSKPKVPYYYISMHYGICHGPIDSVNQVYVREKPIWCGNAVANTTIDVNQPDLFGGEEKEGGVVGSVDVFLGGPDQLMTAEVTSRFGRTPTTFPGYRGIANLFFRGRGNGPGGFLWSVNNPYMPGAWVNVTRAPNPPALNVPEYSQIIVPLGEPQTLTFLNDFFVGVGSGYLTATQNVGAYARAIDSGVATYRMRFTASLTFNINGSAAAGAVGVRYRFLDRDGALIQQVENGSTNVINPTVDFTFAIPPGTRSIEYGARVIPISLIGISISISNRLRELFGQDLERQNHCQVDRRLGVLPDANPAMMIFESLTNPIWGMGYPVNSINIESFRNAAETLFLEDFGLSMQWREQMSIEKFIQEVIDHIHAQVYVNPTNGLWEIVLIRGGYNLATAMEINPQNSTLRNQQRKATGEIINEIVIEWTDPNNEEKKTKTYQDLASIAQTGEIVSATRNYYGVRNEALANRLGARDLREASYPLWSASVTANRTLRSVLPGMVLRLVWPEDGITSMAVRVLKVDYGTAGSRAVKFDVIEDIFGLAQTTYSDEETTGWVPPSAAPLPVAQVRPITAPLSLLLRSGYSLGDLSDDDFPSTVVALFAGDEAQQIESIDVLGPSLLPTGTVTTAITGTIDPSPYGDLPAGLPNEAQSVLSAAVVNAICAPQEAAEGAFLYIDGDDASGEIVMLFSFNEIAQTWQVARGLYDTVPRAHPAGTRAWWIGSSLGMDDPGTSAAGVPVDYKLLPLTTGGRLDPALAPVVPFTPSDRPYAPIRPGNTQIAGAGFGVAAFVEPSLPPSVSVTWSNRNRLSEDTIAPLWTDGNVTPEPGQTTTLRVLEPFSGALLTQFTGLVGTTYALDTSSLSLYRFYQIEFVSVRDGFESIQGATRTLDLQRVGYGYNYGYDYGQNDGS